MTANGNTTAAQPRIRPKEKADVFTLTSRSAGEVWFAGARTGNETTIEYQASSVVICDLWSIG